MKRINLITLTILSLSFITHAQTFEWAKSFGGLNNDGGNSISVDTSGNVYTTGYFRGTVDFDPGAGTTNLTSPGGADIFVQKYTVTTAGVIANGFDNELLLYPNPTDGNFSIDLG